MSDSERPELDLRTEAEACRWLMGLVDYERTPPSNPRDAQFYRLDHFARTLSAMGDPQNDFPAVQIAGTSGKGWIASALASICQAAGLRAGFYSSPHLKSFRERIQVDGHPISARAFAKGISELGPKFGGREVKRFRTVFEILTALAFRTFSEREVDIAFIETGLGGQLDCTTATPSCLSIIATIGLDHTSVLGETIGAIALDKAGIIKPDTVAVISPQTPEAKRKAWAQFRKEAKKKNAQLIDAGRAVKLELITESLAGSRWRARLDGNVVTFQSKTFGPAAEANLKTVLAAVVALREMGFDLPDKAVREGLKEWRWPGRMEVVSLLPPIVLDGAHNPLGAAALRTALERVLGDRPIQWVLGMMIDKDIDGILSALVGGRPGDGITVCPTPSPRGVPPEELAEMASKHCERVGSSEKIADAVRQGFREAKKNKAALVVTGSLYIIEPARRAIKRILR